jgi:hypothetical protein
MVTKFLEKFAISMLKKYRKICRRGLTHLDATPIFKKIVQVFMRHPVECYSLPLLILLEQNTSKKVLPHCGPARFEIYSTHQATDHQFVHVMFQFVMHVPDPEDWIHEEARRGFTHNQIWRPGGSGLAAGGSKAMALGPRLSSQLNEDVLS